ncbi:MutS-related protein [Pedobacter sp. AW1-32]|uniref:MutS-related protein n=1 Tax=Pedobacter sp. AW1-32 TaxID=3383026 RepID=UPI003FED7CCC
MLNSQAEIIADYKKKIAQAGDTIRLTKREIDKLSFARIGMFGLEILFFVLLVSSADNVWRSFIELALLCPVLVFIFIVRKQSKLDEVVSFQEKLLWVFKNELNVLQGKENGYNNGEDHELEWHPYSSDLDIFGKSSLFNLINRSTTKNGDDLLAQRLSVKSKKETILLRQSAIVEIREKIQETFAFRAYLQGTDNSKIDAIKTQLGSQLGACLEFTRNRFLRIYVAIMPYVSLLLIVAAIAMGGILWQVLTFLAIVNIGLTVFRAADVSKVFYGFGGNSNLLNNYASAIHWTENQEWKAAYIKSFFDSERPVSTEIRNLTKIIQNFDARLNFLVGGLLNALLLWDFRCSINLDKWYSTASKNVSAALDHLGDFEELISFATLSYNQPDWNFPTIEDNFTLETAEIGHPLIPEHLRINNDYVLADAPTVDIVTGSNMAGKSTFLRTLGINLALAYAGAPVCAKQMKTSVFALVTYMRIKDSLNESTSTFKAELNRLKMILDLVVRDKTTFVLIDEMLRGTNSRDKYLGSKVFVEKLIAERTPALFATHDLQLADLKEKYADTLRNFHFDIQLIDREMKFDYKLKHGPCATFNAAILLEQIGLKLD